MVKSYRRVIVINLLMLLIVSFLITPNIYCAEISLQNAPAVEFQLEERGGNPEAGHDFWAVFTVKKELWTKESLPPLSKLAFFQGEIGFNPKLIEPVEVEPGGMVTGKGWTTELEWDKTKPAKLVRVSLKGPKDEKNGLNGYGVLLRIRFRALTEAGGPTFLWTKPNNYITDFKKNNLFAFTGLATNVKGEDIPIRGPGHWGPENGLGDSGYFTIIPKEPRITIANCHRQTVRVSLDRITGAALKDRTEVHWNGTLYALGAGAKDWIALSINEVIPFGTDLILQLDTSVNAKFALNDKLKLSYTAEKLLVNGESRQTLAGETPIFVVSSYEQPSEAGIGQIKPLKLSYQGKELKSYSGKTPPTFEAKVAEGLYDWTWILFGPDGSRLNIWGGGPFDLLKEISINPTWPNGEYRLLLVAFGGDYTRTIFSTTSVRFTVRQNE